MKLLSQVEVSDKRVFLRADLDVPLREAQVTSDKLQVTSQESSRLQNLKPTVDWLLEHGASQIIIAGHVDRPKGPNSSLSTKNLLEPLEKILGQKIVFLKQSTVYSLPSTAVVSSRKAVDRVFLLENLRFWPGEVANDSNFAQKLASMTDKYVNEAFGNSHRTHASMVTLPSLLPHAAGLHLEKEVEVLSKLLDNPQHPFIAIVGGAKLETKIPVIENLSKIADFVLVGGRIAKEYSQTTDYGLQTTAVDSRQSTVDKIVVATSDTKDIDQKSINQFKSVISTAKTIVWNGPMGVFEEGFEAGTLAVAQAVIDSGAYSVIGGGETTEFLASKGLLSKFSFVSSGGGAMLEFLSGKKLPGLVALE